MTPNCLTFSLTFRLLFWFVDAFDDLFHYLSTFFTFCDFSINCYARHFFHWIVPWIEHQHDSQMIHNFSEIADLDPQVSGKSMSKILQIFLKNPDDNPKYPENLKIRKTPKYRFSLLALGDAMWLAPDKMCRSTKCARAEEICWHHHVFDLLCSLKVFFGKSIQNHVLKEVNRLQNSVHDDSWFSMTSP